MFGYHSSLKKRHFIFVNVVYLLLVASIILIGNSGNPSIERVEGEEPTYTITLNGDNAPLSLSTDSFGTGTGTGRDVYFDYANAKRVASYHAVFAEDGTISNNVDTRITSIKSITATFTGGEATLTVGWRAMPSTNPQIITSGVTVNFTNNPYFFMVTHTGTEAGYLYLTSLVITYSCTPTEEAGGETYFGMYPQSKVIDSALISTLNSAAGSLPSSGNNQAWTDYGYYISGSVSSFMWYIDLANGGNTYRGVYFTTYRPHSTVLTSTASNSYQDQNGYDPSNVYWFKYDPIVWRVLDVQFGNAFLMADLILDSQDYYYSTSSRTIGEATVYANNYEHSHIRSWLSDNFYNAAFTAEEKERIQTTTVDNSVASTGYATNAYAGNNTNDKVFLLSYVEATSTTYGLSTPASRQLKTSAYSQAQGAYTGTNTFGYWWTRSPYNGNSSYVRYVYTDGYVYENNAPGTCFSVFPALWISI